MTDKALHIQKKDKISQQIDLLIKTSRNNLTNHYQTAQKKKGETMRIIDFIAGTTDSYATQMASEITGRSSPLYTFSPETGLN